MKAGLKLRDEAEKHEVEKGVHLLEETSGMYSQYHTTYLWSHSFSSGIAEKARAAQRHRQMAKKREKEAEMETDD